MVNEWYAPLTKVAVLIDGVFVNALVISNKAHLWNALSIPYMIKIDGIEGYRYMAHDDLRFIALPPQIQGKKRGKRK